MLSFSSPILLLLALGLFALTAVIAVLRGVLMRGLTKILLGFGLLLIAVAAGDPALLLFRQAQVVVMVDVSSSTRGADYHDARKLAERLRQLLGNIPSRLYYFSEANIPSELHRDAGETAGERTVFAPPIAHAIVLFSDGQFELPAATPPTFPVIDAALQSASDARIDRIEIRDNELSIAIVNSGPARELSVTGTASPITLDRGSQIVTMDLSVGNRPVSATISAADLWPENDSLTIYPPPPQQLERWWVGSSPPDGSWVAMGPQSLPTESSAYLVAGVLVLDNVDADALSSVQRQRLVQFVRDLSGGLIILGGDRAFAAGGYPGTELELLSPLSSVEPGPSQHWILLADSSGSMASVVSQTTRWGLAAEALRGLVRQLPPNDPVSIGSFARELRWWSRGKNARQTAELLRFAPEIVPHGPTNLQPALQSILDATDASLPTEILILSDADARIDSPSLLEAMRAKRVRLHLLVTETIPPDNPVLQLVLGSGGSAVQQSDPQQWQQTARQLLRSAAPTRLLDQPVNVRYVGPLAALSSRTVRLWNQVWPKEQVTALAVREKGNAEQVVAAQWNFGAGRVLAASFHPDADAVNTMSDLVRSEPRDPRFKLTWESSRELRLSIDAIESGRFLNELRFVLELREADDLSRVVGSHAVPQTAPGRYELSLPAPRSSRVASVLLEGRSIGRRAVAGRYPPEFDEIGINRQTLHELASRSGARVIEAHDRGPIEFKLPQRRIDLRGILAAAGAALIATGLIHWRLR